jgi:TM2 domain-containing membrane protein YozV
LAVLRQELAGRSPPRILPGTVGIDRFYLGYTGIGIAKLLTIGGLGIWALVDFVLIAVRAIPDSEGLPLR